MHLSMLFPVGLQCHWLNPEVANLSQTVQSWLLDPDSLTARLKSQCQQFNLEVLGQKVEPCRLEEACDGIARGDDVLVREVLLYCDGKPHIFARSLLPLTSLTGEEEKLANLGTQPLGHVIFNSPSLNRNYIEVGQFGCESSVGQLCQKLKINNVDSLWGRRSLFSIEGKPLTVAEVFLPDALIYQGT